MTVIIENLDETRADEVAQLWGVCWADGHAAIVPAALTELRTPESFQRRTRDYVEHTLVAVSDGEVLGFVMTRADEIYQMYVGAQARGKGVAQRLMQAGEARIKARGHSSAWLGCAVGNERAARFYTKTGWINKRTETMALDTLDDPFYLEEWIFEKDLT